MKRTIWWLAILLTGSPALAKDDLLKHYLPTYEASRKEFRRLAETAKGVVPRAAAGAVKIPSREDGDLTMDTLYLPPREKTDGLVVVVSGVHGAEAFAGTAVQRWLLGEMLRPGGLGKRFEAKRTGYLFLHAVNPYGFKHGRRVSENNVDLNRNFSVDRKVFATRNQGYGRLEPMLNPKGPAASTWYAYSKFLWRTVGELRKWGLDALTQAIGAGQYEHPKGIMFGGRDFEPQKALVEKLLLERAAPYRKVLVLDLHTGYGKRGYMHLLPNPPDFPEMKARWREVFGGYPVEDPEAGSFYSNEGDFSTFASRLLEANGKKTVPMLIEFGTIDSDGTLGSVRTLSRLILENQNHWHGARSPAHAARIRRDFRGLFFPESVKWRRQVMDQSVKHLPEFMARFSRLL